jgi:uncharacterized membrane protein
MDENKANNPYAAPTAEVLSAPEVVGDLQFIAKGRSLPFGQAMVWVSQGWSLFTRAPLIWIVNVVIYIGILFGVTYVPLLGLFVSYILFGFLSAGLMLGAHSQRNGNSLEFADIFSGFSAPHITPLFIVGLLYMLAWVGLIIIAGILFALVLGVSGAVGALLSGNTSAITGLSAGAGLGLLFVSLIVVALSIPLIMAFWFAPALVAINGVSPLEAISTSFFACLKNFMPYLLFSIVFTVLFLVGMITLGLGLFVVLPLMYASIYTSYRDIFLVNDGV